MAVAVDQPGHDDPARAIDRLAGREACGEVGGGPHGDDRVAGDGHRTVLDHPACGVHGDDAAAADEQVDGGARVGGAGGAKEGRGGEQGA
jgi:hypothetical protein